MTDTNSTTNAAASTADEPSAENQTSTSGAPAQPSKTENAGSKADAGLSNSGDTLAAPTVSQETFDRLHHDYQVVLAALTAVKAELEALKQDYESATAASKMAWRERDETREYAEKLKGFLAAKTQELEKASAAENAKPAAAALYAHPDGEVGALKQRLHDLLAEAKGVADRLADVVPPKDPALSVSGMVHTLGRDVRKLI